VGRAAAIEMLEGRVLMSVTAQQVAGPVEIVGNSWTYAGPDGSITYTVKGPTTLNGQAVIERDSVSTQSGTTISTGQQFYNLTSGGFVSYQDNSSNVHGQLSSTTYSPFKTELPASMSGGSQFTIPGWTDTTTFTPAGGTPSTSTSTYTAVATLVSEAPNVPIQAGGTNYMCWELDGQETSVPQNGSGTTDVTQTFFAPNVGLVEVKDITNGSTVLLSNFTGTAFHLEATAPSQALAGEAFDPAVQVTIKDTAGATDADAADAVTVTASIDASSTGTGTLTGTGGVATFSGLSISKPGRYVMDFADSAGRSVQSATIQVSAGKLVFKRPIRNEVSGSALEPAVEVELVNSKGKLIKDAPSSVVTLTAEGANASNPITGNTASLVGGVATFGSLKLVKPADYILDATDDEGDVMGTSNQFEITGVHMAFAKQPGATGANAGIRYKLELKDSKNRLVTSSALGLTITLNTVQGGEGAALLSAADIFSFGVAQNESRDNPVAINAAGKYTLTFTVISDSSNSFNYPIDPITSDEFEVVGNQLVFVKSGGRALPNIPLNYKVEMQDYKHHLVTTAADQLMFTLNPLEGATGVLSGNADTLIGGIADNESPNPLMINLPGSYTLTVSDVPGNGEPAALGDTSKAFTLKAAKGS
jgi:hypothetical protein